MRPILADVDWKRVNRKVRSEVRNREQYCPAISLFRWWARRPNALVGAILEAYHCRDPHLVSDPFSGGGTVAVEGARRGLSVFAQDLNPWASWGLRCALGRVSPHELAQASTKLIEVLRPLERRLYGAENGTVAVCNFRVRAASCPSCNVDFFLYPYSLVSQESRSSKVSHGFYGCVRCGSVGRHRLDVKSRRCRNCDGPIREGHEPLYPGRLIACPHCKVKLEAAAIWGERPRWKKVLERRLSPTSRQLYFSAVDEPPEFLLHRRSTVPPALQARIPKGHETGLLLRSGFKRWLEIYTPSQMQLLGSALSLARELGCSPEVESRLSLAVAGCGEMAGLLCRWDRYHTKAFSALSNHRYSALGLAVEINVLSRAGAGTLPRRLRASVEAATWAERNSSFAHANGPLLRSTGRRVDVGAGRVIVACGSSERQRLKDAVVGLVVTDPPYYDAVQYAELSAPLNAWLACIDSRWSELGFQREAVPNTHRGMDDARYATLLKQIFSETSRTLRGDGRVVLTYHCNDFRGWDALGRALYQAGLRIVAIGVAHAENETDHTKTGRRTFSKDLILECWKEPNVGPGKVLQVTRCRDEQDWELLAMGQSLALHSGGDAVQLACDFLRRTAGIAVRRVHRGFPSARLTLSETRPYDLRNRYPTAQQVVCRRRREHGNRYLHPQP